MENKLEVWELEYLIEFVFAKALKETSIETKKYFVQNEDNIISKFSEGEKILENLRNDKYSELGKATIILNKLSTMRDIAASKLTK